MLGLLRRVPILGSRSRLVQRRRDENRGEEEEKPESTREEKRWRWSGRRDWRTIGESCERERDVDWRRFGVDGSEVQVAREGRSNWIRHVKLFE